MPGKVYFTVFAGRRRYLSVLMVYVKPLLQQRALDAVHLWDYCRIAPDREYVKGLADAARGIEVIKPPASDAGAPGAAPQAQDSRLLGPAHRRGVGGSGLVLVTSHITGPGARGVSK